MSASYRQGHLGLNPFLSDIPLLYAGKGIDPTTNKASGDGCFFDFINVVRAPYLRHDGSSQQDYYLYFKARAAKNVELNAIASLKTALVAFSSLFSWTDLTGDRIKLLADATTQLQTAIARAFTVDDTKKTTKALLSTGMQDLAYHIDVDELEQAAGNLAIYVRLSASLVLDNMGENDKEITVDRVLTDTDIGTVRCIPELPKPACTLLPRTFRSALKEYNKDIPPRFFDLSADGKKKVYDTCQQLREFATGNLKLSTLDALLVRWAAVKLSKLDKALADPAQAADIASASQVDVADLGERCWNADDNKKLEGVVKAMGKKLL